ncbi:stage II sporulation protein M [Methanobrevibacter sp.]|uniref:stage II sporulation protein M n=1 Tax=Methanobrevibacter sp. TaxID=66852 RepID=UPI0026E112BB|nr:stage II sporulation protein M [Methanobrevibacter sp.]MDO5859996.1 stage II sporulation protein M [Methanobrevibacter sp.]
MSKFDVFTKFKDLTAESLKDNKKLIIGLYIIFIICFILAWILSADKISAMVNSTLIANSTAQTPNMSSQVGALDLFISNEMGGIVTYLGSILFCIPAVIMLLYNAVNLGAIGQLFATISPKMGILYLVYIIPHGIFEITATVLESVAGILLFLFIWRFVKAWRTSDGAFEAFEKTKKGLIQSIVIFIFSTILLAIAAPIEAYVSVPLSAFICGGL